MLYYLPVPASRLQNPALKLLDHIGLHYQEGARKEAGARRVYWRQLSRALQQLGATCEGQEEQTATCQGITKSSQSQQL